LPPKSDPENKKKTLKMTKKSQKSRFSPKLTIECIIDFGGKY
jgi:hypothetical protein